MMCEYKMLSEYEHHMYSLYNHLCDSVNVLNPLWTGNIVFGINLMLFMIPYYLFYKQMYKLQII